MTQMSAPLDRPYWVVVGTRPEVIKQISVYWALTDRLGRDSVALIGTGQHRELLVQALEHFGATLDVNLDLMVVGQGLAENAARIQTEMERLLRTHMPRCVIVQGDTTTAAMTAVAAFHLGIKVAHNEAGLRSYDLQNPYPEEANRRWISAVATHHFAPTALAQARLLQEGVSAAAISVVGNSGIDALQWTLRNTSPDPSHPVRKFLQRTGVRPVLVTAHRRENDADAMDRWFDGLTQFLEAHRDVGLVCPIHPNQRARQAIERHLGGHERVLVCDPIDYAQACHLIADCLFVVTDSGGIQEETATLDVPCVIVRKTTERPEAIEHGTAQLADPANVDGVLTQISWAARLAELPPVERRSQTSPYANAPFGDGSAGVQIAARLATLSW
jgi:UDP-N-acetylglucosamine 2-epimerase (non-hydrolysing)